MRRTILAALALAATLLQGCASTYSTMVSEDKVPALAMLKQETAAHPNHTSLVPTHAPGGPEVKLAVHEIECPTSDDLIILIHGVFADYTTWRFLQGDLVRDHDVWLVDLPGCGKSEKPDPDSMGPGGYSPSAMSGRVLEAIRARLALRDHVGDVTLVGHSLGGTVIMRMFSDHRDEYADVLDRIHRLVLISPMDAALTRPDPVFQQIAESGSLVFSLGAATGFMEEKIAEATVAGAGMPDRALREEVDFRVRMLSDPITRRPLQAMLRQATSWTPDNRPDWEANEKVVALYNRVTPDTLIIWGERDEILACAMGYKLAAQLPHAHLLCLPMTKHSPQVERPDAVNTAIRQFADTGTVASIDGAHMH